MPARCHVDTCSVKWTEQTNPAAYIANVDTDEGSATPTIVCGPDGLQVALSDDAGQILSSLPDGLFANLPAAVVTTLSGNPANQGVGPGADSASPQDSAIYSWINTTGRDSLVFISGEWNFTYGILGPTHAFTYGGGFGQKAGSLAPGAYGAGGTPPLSPFNAMLAMRLLANVNAPPTTPRKACRVGIGGLVHVSVPTSAEQKTERVPFMYMIRVIAGATLNIKSDCFFEGPSQTVNVIATPAAGTGLAGTGHELWNLQVAAVPL